ncbi:MAG: PD40 domain-containing protein [Flavobacteriales bacterium]|nr:PD40 domain-containing protein [Flavobacteriales bacterium]
MTRTTGIVFFVLLSSLAFGQGDQQVRAKADAFFTEKDYVSALPLYSQLVSLNPGDRVLNYQFGACLLFNGTDRDKAIGHLKFATEDPSIPPDAWYWLGRAYHLSYRFKDALTAYQRYQGTGSKKELEGFPIAALDKQCRNGMNLLSNLKEITVHNKVEVDDTEFFRFYELGDIGGRIVVLPEELKTTLDKKSKRRTLVYLPEKGGPIYFASYGKDGKTGLDIYRTELLTSGSFATPVKLAGYVNTDQDEDFAFLHPDGRSFYFSSKGHNSMGGYDVFRSAYDKVSETFGPPENLDFAVNTPDDDVFYMTDAENKQACFASGRSSRQGKLHVYRVSTAQVPVVVTVMKGTFASTIDKNDRKAHIMVEDAVTRERVADVRTDINGSYVLAFPRSGTFRYLVECGPSGRTHTGTVDVPRASSARAFRQELELRINAGMEELTIRNYFDDPLEEDMIALMMDEIKRRARLDVTGDRPQSDPVVEPAVEGDVLTQAGFAGDMTEAKAVQLAKDDARELEALEESLGEQSVAAYTIARDAATAAEQAARQSSASVEKAGTATDEEQRNAYMREAAQLRQQSRTADLRARAAYSTARDLESERTAVRQRAATAGKLATDLSNSVSTGSREATLAQLRTLKERLDVKSGPEGDLSIAEQVRRDLTEQEKEAARRLNQATAKRSEETEFADRIDRSKRERDATKSKSRKEELDRTIAEQEQQLSYMHAEVDAAFNTARELGSEVAVKRGEHSLLHHLSTQPVTTTGQAPSKEEIASLGQRIAGIGSRIESIQVDARYDGSFVEPTATAEARSFNWELAGPDAVLAAASTPTQRMTRDGSGDAVLADGRTTIPQRSATGEVINAQVDQVPVSTGDELVNADRTIGLGNDAQEESASSASNRTGGERTSGDAGVASNSGDVGKEGSTADASSGLPDGSGQELASNTTSTSGTALPRSGGERSDTSSGVRTGQDTIDGSNTSTTSGSESMPASTAEFLLENERAELQQAIAAERDPTRRAELESRLTDLDAREAALSRTPEVETTDTELGIEGVDMQRTPLTFFPDTDEEDIVTLLYGNYEVDKQRLSALEDPATRADGLSGLELMLADSMRAEMVRQAAILELAPQQGEVIGPRIERLRQLRQAHVQEAERIVEDAREEEALAAGGPVEGLPRTQGRASYAPGEDPINDRFIHIHDDPQEVYASKVVHRANSVQEAVALKEADLARMVDLDHRIDSLEEAMVGLPRKEFDRKRREADKLIDERMIIRSDLGQRSAFLTKEEWRNSTDSLKRIDGQVNKLGLPPDEAALVMSEDMRSIAKTRFDEASSVRKKADRTEDIMERDSLLRAAYGMELEALEQLDRSITVKTYLLGGRHQRGETLAYEEIARRVLGLPDEPMFADGRAPKSSAVTTGASVVKPAATSSSTTAATSGQAGNEATIAVTTGAEQAIAAGTVGRSTTDAEVADAQPTAQEQGSAEPDVADPANTNSTATASDVNGARQAAEALADRAEGSMPRSARNPIQLYENYLQAETVMLKAEALDPAFDPDLLSLKKDQATRESADLEQRSLSLTDRAASMEDSAATARKRDRERLEQLAVRSRLEADSLHELSLTRAEEARDLELQQRDAEQAKVLRNRLVKYYYLSGEEQDLVLDDSDMSRYFQMKARALEQMDAASEAEAAARVNRQLGEVLRQEAGSVNTEERSGRITGEEAVAKRTVLYDRAELLSLRADSLNNVAARLRGAANINESQAGVLMQGMPADRSTEWMAMEMRTRRTEPQLAQLGNAVPVAAERQVETSSANTRTAPPVSNPAPGSRQITTPFGTDASASRPAVARPIAEIPADQVPAMVFPTVLETDMFEFRPVPERQPAAIAMDAVMPGGIVFKVQIGAFRSPISESVFNDMTPVMGEHTSNGFIRYTAGLFTGFQQAARAKDRVRDRGYRDAFVVAYRDGVRIPLGEAMREARAAEQAALASARSTTSASSTTGQQVATNTAGASTGGSNTNAAVRRDNSNTVLEPVRTEPGTTQPNPAVIQRPVELATTTTPAQAQRTKDVLTKYPATAEAIVDAYTPPADAANYYNVPGAAPATQVETIKGLFYTVQVGVYSKPVPLDKLFNIAPLNSERTETAKIRYTTGRYTDTEQARVRKDEAVGAGVKDAFVTAYLNGKRIPMQEAAALLERFGPAILARP